MKCPSCRAESPPGTKFCSKCGAALSQKFQACPTCGAKNLTDRKFCRTCGTALVGAADESSGKALEMPSGPDAKPNHIQCSRCGTDNKPSKRFCRLCGARLIEPAKRIQVAIAELRSIQESLSKLPQILVAQHLDTISELDEQLSEAQEAYDNGDRATGDELLTTIERRTSQLATDVIGLRDIAALAQEAERAQEKMASTVEEARASLPLLTLVKTSSLEKAIQRLETRLASGNKALELSQFKRARTLLSSTGAEKDIKALSNRLRAAQSKQRELESLREQVEEQLVDLGARADTMREDFIALALESPEAERKLSLILGKLTQGQEMREKGNLLRARKLVRSIETDLDALERYRLAKVKERKDKEALHVGLAQQSAALREKMRVLREDLESLDHVDATRQLGTLAQSEKRVRVADAADHAKAEKELENIGRALHGLRQQLPTLHQMQTQIADLLSRVAVLREGYEALQQKLMELKRPDLAPQLQLVERNLALLTKASEGKKLESTQPLDRLLSQMEDPARLEEEITDQVTVEEHLAQLLADVQGKVGALMQDLREAKREGAALRRVDEELHQTRAILSHAEQLQLQGRSTEAAEAMETIRMYDLDALKKDIEDELSRVKLLQMKTTLSLTKMPDAEGVTPYNVILSISGGGWQDTSSIQGNIKVSYYDRVDMRKAIDDLTTVINVLFGAQATLRGRMPEVPEDQALGSLSELGDLMYRLFLPTAIQKYLIETESPILITSNDLELPWELMCPENEFLCLRTAMGRMPMMRDFPRRNEYIREDKLRFLLIANPTGDLPATEKEIQWIGDRLRDEPVTVEIWRRDEVTGLKLHRALASGRYDVIHYSGHAHFNLKKPDESGLLLAGQNVLIAQTIQRTLRGRPLIFLNACESGREVMVDGEVSYTASESEGLASSFILGGALGIIGTLWPIFDEGAAEFASTFYEGLLAGQSLGEAVRLARLRVRESRPHDVTWASFVLYGDPTLSILE